VRCAHASTIVRIRSAGSSTTEASWSLEKTTTSQWPWAGRSGGPSASGRPSDAGPTVSGARLGNRLAKTATS
jgi:hypothetical protein